MGYPKQKRRPAATTSRGPAELRTQAPSDRLAALRFTHGRLLKAIAAKKQSLDKLDARIDETARRMATLSPLRDQLVKLDGDVHRLFQELLARKRQPREVRRALMMVHGFLIRAGVLAPAGWSDDESKHGFTGERGGDDEDEDGSGGQPPGGGGFSARRPSDATKDQTLRALFRRLAMAMHPDRVADDAEKARRTEAMKDLSRAYADRDLARLLILEKQWADGLANDVEAVDEEQREAARLEQANRELHIQLQNLTAELKARRRSPTGRMSDELRRPARGGGPDPVASLAADLAQGLAQLQRVHARLRAYAEGRLSLELLIATLAPSPAGRRGRDDQDDDAPDLFIDPETWLRR